MKAVLRAKLIALSAPKKKMERSFISRSTVHMKALELIEGNTPKMCR